MPVKLKKEFLRDENKPFSFAGLASLLVKKRTREPGNPNLATTITAKAMFFLAFDFKGLFFLFLFQHGTNLTYFTQNATK